MCATKYSNTWEVEAGSSMQSYLVSLRLAWASEVCYLPLLPLPLFPLLLLPSFPLLFLLSPPLSLSLALSLSSSMGTGDYPSVIV